MTSINKNGTESSPCLCFARKLSDEMDFFAIGIVGTAVAQMLTTMSFVFCLYYAAARQVNCVFCVRVVDSKLIVLSLGRALEVFSEPEPK